MINHETALGVGVSGASQGLVFDNEILGLRWWDSQRNLLLTVEERAERLAEILRAQGIDPEEI